MCPNQFNVLLIHTTLLQRRLAAIEPAVSDVVAQRNNVRWAHSFCMQHGFAGTVSVHTQTNKQARVRAQMYKTAGFRNIGCPHSSKRSQLTAVYARRAPTTWSQTCTYAMSSTHAQTNTCRHRRTHKRTQKHSPLQAESVAVGRAAGRDVSVAHGSCEKVSVARQRGGW